MFKIHRFQNALTTIWSGGTTAQLFIYPEDTVFAERNFDFRISTATIDVEESDFTPLPIYNRLLAVLEGNLDIIHQGKYSKKLQKFENDRFNGSWQTSSKGKARDFNVIYNDNFELKFSHREIFEPTFIQKQSDYLLLFILNKSVEFEGFELNLYDLIEVEIENILLPKGIHFFQIELARI
jgi:environmental stress-induced protein Ves